MRNQYKYHPFIYRMFILLAAFLLVLIYNSGKAGGKPERNNKWKNISTQLKNKCIDI